MYKSMLRKISFVLLLFVLLLSLSACASADAPVEQPSDEQTAVVETVGEGQPAEAEAEPVSEEPPVAIPTEVADYCLECHTDKDTLVALAKPEEAVESESEGVG